MSDSYDQMPKTSRRRIVVPLGPGPAGSRARFPPAPPATPGATLQRKGRAGKVLGTLCLLLAAVVLALAVGAFLGWHHYQTTPTYSLALLVDAAQRNDVPAVDKVVDTDKIVDNFAGQVIEKAAGRYGGALSGDLNKTIRSRVPSLLPEIKQEVRDAVAARVKEVSTRANKKPFFLIALTMPYFVNVTTAADKANAFAEIHDQRVRVDLERSGDGWKVVAVQDDALVERMVDGVIKDLPAIGRGSESEIRKNTKKPPAQLAFP